MMKREKAAAIGAMEVWKVIAPALDFESGRDEPLGTRSAMGAGEGGAGLWLGNVGRRRLGQDQNSRAKQPRSGRRESTNEENRDRLLVCIDTCWPRCFQTIKNRPQIL